MSTKIQSMTPKEIVAELDKYIIGQDEAKKSVAIALRNRYRRSLLSDEMREEITPKNILMMGPTGCGKTEIARRLAKLMQAPFVKVDHLTYPEVKKCIEAFVYGVNTPSRWGTQAPFSNITLDWTVPDDLAELPAIVGGKEMDFCYKD